MRASNFLIATLKETPADAEVISHKLMLRAGMIRRLASGLYTWMPMGLRVLRKVERIVREEMDRANAQEVLMPAIQPAELWEESGRWFEYGAELLRVKDRHNRDFCVGPTHEEVITDMARNELKSYKQLPVNFYQIQTKFRDERRPRFGIMRAREFLMKDAYSFHANTDSLDQTYDQMYKTYTNIFTRLGLEFRAVQADSGSIGGNSSHEFHVLAESGEDAIAFSTESDYAANIEMAEAVAPETTNTPSQSMTLVDTPTQRTIDEVCQHLDIRPEQTVKTLLVKGAALAKATGQSKNKAEPAVAPQPVALIIRGDHTLNEIKAEKLDGVASPLEMATEEEIKAAAGCEAGFIGPVNLNIPVIVDRAAAVLVDFVCGANQTGKHYQGVNWNVDATISQIADLRNIEEGDASPCGKGQIVIKRGIEVGHIFKLGNKYSGALNATVLNENGKAVVMEMGCYGIGVSRVVASSVEQNNDDKGIVWPDAIAPFQIVVVPLNMHKSEAVAEKAEGLYQELSALGVDVLLDDRNERPGVKFADMELIGIPHRVVISERGLGEGTVEYKGRRDADNQLITVEEMSAFIRGKLGLTQ